MSLNFRNDTLVGIMQEAPHQPNKIRIETPIGINIETPDDNPIIDILVIILTFVAFCLYVFGKYIKNNKK